MPGALFAVTLALSACLSTKVETLGPNMVRLNMVGDQSPNDSSAIREILLLGARETIARGYTLFRLTDLRPEPAAFVNGVQQGRANFTVVILMFQEGDPGAYGVYNAEQLLRSDTSGTPQ